MRAVIMAGGEGVRLRPYTRILPKPMLPLGNRPILAWLLDRLVAGGVTEVTLAVRYMGYVFRSYFGRREAGGGAGALRGGGRAAGDRRCPPAYSGPG